MTFKPCKLCCNRFSSAESSSAKLSCSSQSILNVFRRLLVASRALRRSGACGYFSSQPRERRNLFADRQVHGAGFVFCQRLTSKYVYFVILFYDTVTSCRNIPPPAGGHKYLATVWGHRLLNLESTYKHLVASLNQHVANMSCTAGGNLEIFHQAAFKIHEDDPAKVEVEPSQINSPLPALKIFVAAAHLGCRLSKAVFTSPGDTSPMAQDAPAPTADVKLTMTYFSSSEDIGAWLFAHLKLAVFCMPLASLQGPAKQLTHPYESMCSRYFVELMKWMEMFLEIADKIAYPNKKCGAKLGNFDLAGMCKEWVTLLHKFFHPIFPNILLMRKCQLHQQNLACATLMPKI
ncbi:hypothetical protein C8J57DRAFT_1593257 [Mycena rebaudengoi]|nr:hypothetical protein C8J57DRAFT_1593257 [Mycena rebaudengoi]